MTLESTHLTFVRAPAIRVLPSRVGSPTTAPVAEDRKSMGCENPENPRERGNGTENDEDEWARLTVT
jgi:hypothetical protein